MADPSSSEPQSLVCPLSHETMTDPVVTPSGHTYERTAIERWLEHSPSSPVTRAPLEREQLVTNRALRDVIEARAAGGSGGESAGAAPELPPGEDLQLGLKLTSFRRDTNFPQRFSGVVSVTVPEGTRRVPVHVVMVIDVSGSMSAEVDMMGEGGEREKSGLSVLDICKHSAKTVLHMLGAGDMFSLVTFSSSACVRVERLQMGFPGARGSAVAALEALHVGGGTNLWGGLAKGLELGNEDIFGVSSSVMLLTDGLPTHEPPRGHLPMLERWIDRNGLNCSVSTFGFGYSLQSALLSRIANLCDGQFYFIPDSLLVGTVFVHFISNLLTMYARGKIDLEAADGVALDCDSIPDGFDWSSTSGGATVDLGSIQLGQTRDIPVTVSLLEGVNIESVISSTLPPLTATLRYKNLTGAETETELDLQEYRASFANADAVVALQNWHVARLRLVSCLGEVVDRVTRSSGSYSSDRSQARFNECRSLVNDMVDSVRELSPMGQEGRALLQDIEGQVLEAVSREDWFWRWGLHYFCSLRCSHLKQLCCNFKDSGLQLYGGSVFRGLRDIADDLFLNLPMPTPPPASVWSTGYGQAPGASPGVPTIRSMPSQRQFHNRDDPCLDGSTGVKMANGKIVQAKLLSRGMRVATLAFDKRGVPKHATSVVACILKTFQTNDMTPMVFLGEAGALLTPYHPIYNASTSGISWTFPIECGTVHLVKTNAIFSVVLSDPRHAIVLDGDLAAATLGHEITGAVIGHPYLGSKLVLKDLEHLPGWDNGLVEIPGGSMIRTENGLISGFRLNETQADILPVFF